MEGDFLVFLVKYFVQGFQHQDRQRPYTYLELGISQGGTFNIVAPHFDIAYAVDNTDCHAHISHNSNLIWSQCTTGDFIASLTDEKFDVVFIDADHSHKQSLKDFYGILPFVQPNGFILLHDTYPLSPEYFHYCGEVYKTAWHIRMNVQDSCEIVTIPSEYGISIVRKADKQLLWSE